MAVKKAREKPPKPPRTNQSLYTSPARVQVCGGCRRPVWAGYVDGLRVRVDPVALAAADVMMAMIVRRRLYLKMTTCLVALDDDRMGLTARWPTMAQHSCKTPIRVPGRAPVTRAPLPGADVPPY